MISVAGLRKINDVIDFVSHCNWLLSGEWERYEILVVTLFRS